MASDKVPMLAEGHRQLTDEVKRLKLERPEIIDSIEEARAHGDLARRAVPFLVAERGGRVRLEVAQLVLDRLGDHRVVARRELVVVYDRLREDLRRDDRVCACPCPCA